MLFFDRSLLLWADHSLFPSGNGHSKVAPILDGDFYQTFTSIPCFFCVIRVTCLIVTVCLYHLCSQEEEKYHDLCDAC